MGTIVPQTEALKPWPLVSRGLDIAPASIAALEHRVVAARGRATVLRHGRHVKEAAAQDAEASRLVEELETLRDLASTPPTEGS